MNAIVKLDVFKTKRKTEIKRAEILKVVSIVSSDEVQNDLL